MLEPFIYFYHINLLNLKQGMISYTRFTQYSIMKYCKCLGIGMEYHGLIQSIILYYA